MARNKLTATQARGLSKPGRVGDGDGLYLNVSKSGTKSWVFIYIRDGRRREMGLGAFGSGTAQVGLVAARAKADEIRAILGRGGDPFAEMRERQNRKPGVTFNEVVKSFLATKDGSWRNEKHRAQWVMTLGPAYCSRILKKRVEQIDTNDVVAVLEPHWRSKHETASRLRGRLENVLDYAAVRGLRSGENPARWKGHIEHLLPKPTAEQRMKRGHHAAVPYSNAASMVATLRSKASTSAAALEFLILTAARTGEVLGATWSEIDLEEAVWTVPATRMKAGREHRVPLSRPALALLKRLGEGNRGSPYLFPGGKENRPISATSLQKALSGVGGGDYTLHGWRSTFRDWVAEETRFPSELAEVALAHLVGNEVERAYRRGDALEKRRGLMEAWARYLRGEGEHTASIHMSARAA